MLVIYQCSHYLTRLPVVFLWIKGELLNFWRNCDVASAGYYKIILVFINWIDNVYWPPKRVSDTYVSSVSLSCYLCLETNWEIQISISVTRLTHSDEMCNFYIMYWYDPKQVKGASNPRDLCKLLDPSNLDFPADSDKLLPNKRFILAMKWTW